MAFKLKSTVGLSIGFLLIMLTACTTTTFLQDFHKLHYGMDRSDVLELLGTPKRKEHRAERDWWYYSEYEQGEKVEKMVVFRSNRLIYAGKVVRAPGMKNAEQEDLEFQAQNEVLNSEQERARAKAVPVTSPPSGIESSSDKK